MNSRRVQLVRHDDDIPSVTRYELRPGS